MNFTPNDLSNIVFRKSFINGLDESQVYETIQKITEDYSDYIRELLKVNDQTLELKDRLSHYDKMEDTLKKSLILAQQSSKDIVDNAQKKASNIITEAQNNAKQIIDEANREVVKIQFEAERVKKDLAVYKAKTVSLLNSQLKLLEEADR
ncbi:MAG TPA: DivIVA domain-containing protein [Thermoclostridium sp.]|nr:DivIVA domain-containing protein [Thermoclostridium sp.]